MPSPTDNPYAPPISADPAAAPDPAALWSVQDGYLMVRDGARLPPLPLEGELSEELTPSLQVFRPSAGSTLGALLIALAVAIYLMVEIGGPLRYQAPLIGLVSFILLRRIFHRRTAAKGGMARVHGFSGVTTLKARARRTTWRGRLILLALVFLVFQVMEVPFLLSGVPEGTPPGFRNEAEPFPYSAGWLLLFFAFYLGAIVWVMLDRKLSASRHRDGWFRLRGVPAATLQKLSEIGPSAPPLRLRKVHDFYQRRLPMKNLLAGRRNPWVVLALGMMKLLGAPGLTRRTFSREEARVLATAPPSVLKWWQEESGGNELAAWQPMVTTATDSPLGDSLVLVARYLSPERRHVCILILARVSSGRAFAEIRNLEFRSWTRDGRCLVTSTLAPIEPVPGNQDHDTWRLHANALWHWHTQRCTGVELDEVASVEDLRERITRAQEEHAACLRAAGIYGPVMEVELPASWPVP